MKYVTFDHSLEGRTKVSVVLFDDALVHVNVSHGINLAARGFRASGMPVHGGSATPRSAGFFMLDKNGTVMTFGRSESLNLGPAPDDGELIAKALNGGA